jgi:hypothetical protein
MVISHTKRRGRPENNKSKKAKKTFSPHFSLQISHIKKKKKKTITPNNP